MQSPSLHRQHRHGSPSCPSTPQMPNFTPSTRAYLPDHLTPYTHARILTRRILFEIQWAVFSCRAAPWRPRIFADPDGACRQARRSPASRAGGGHQDAAQMTLARISLRLATVFPTPSQPVVHTSLMSTPQSKMLPRSAYLHVFEGRCAIQEYILLKLCRHPNLFGSEGTGQMREMQ